MEVHWEPMYLWAAEYRCADGRFLMSPRGMAVSNSSIYLSSSGTRVNADIRGWKLHLSESTWCQESVGGICFTNKWRAASLQPPTFSNNCYNAVFSNASLGLTVRFLGVNIRIFWKWESRPIDEWRQCRLSTRQLFFCLHIYNLWYPKSMLWCVCELSPYVASHVHDLGMTDPLTKLTQRHPRAVMVRVTRCTSVVDQDDLSRQLRRTSVDDAPDRPHQSWPRFVVKAYDYACRWQQWWVSLKRCTVHILLRSLQWFF